MKLFVVVLLVLAVLRDSLGVTPTPGVSTLPIPTNLNPIYETLNAVREVQCKAVCGDQSISFPIMMVRRRPSNAMEFVGVITGLKGPTCDFTAQAIDINEEVLYMGGASGIAVPTSGQTVVNIVMTGAQNLYGGGNTAPMIQSVLVTTLPQGFEVQVTAFDPESYFCANNQASPSGSVLDNWLVPGNDSDVDFVWSQCYNNPNANLANPYYGLPLTYQWKLNSLTNVDTSLVYTSGGTWSPAYQNTTDEIYTLPSFVTSGSDDWSIIFEIDVSDGSITSFQNFLVSWSPNQEVTTQVTFILAPIPQAVYIVPGQLSPGGYLAGYEIKSVNVTMDASFVILDQTETFDRTFEWQITIPNPSGSNVYLQPIALCTSLFTVPSTWNSPDVTISLPINDTVALAIVAYLESQDMAYGYCSIQSNVCDNYVPVAGMNRTCIKRIDRIIIQVPANITTFVEAPFTIQNALEFGFNDTNLQLAGTICFSNVSITNTCGVLGNLMYDSLCSSPGQFTASRTIVHTPFPEYVSPLCNVAAFNASLSGDCQADGGEANLPQISGTCDMCLTDTVFNMTLFGPFFLNGSSGGCDVEYCAFFSINASYLDPVSLCSAFYYLDVYTPTYSVNIEVRAVLQATSYVVASHLYTFTSLNSLLDDGLDCSLLDSRSISRRRDALSQTADDFETGLTTKRRSAPAFEASAPEFFSMGMTLNGKKGYIGLRDIMYNITHACNETEVERILNDWFYLDESQNNALMAQLSALVDLNNQLKDQERGWVVSVATLSAFCGVVVIILAVALFSRTRGHVYMSLSQE